MTNYFCSLKEWTLAEWTATGSIIGKETVDPAAPSEATLVKTSVVGKKNEGKFNVPTLAEGEKVIAAVIHVYAKVTAEGKSLKFGFVSPAVFSEPTVKVASSWLTISLSKAQAEALTQANLNALTVLIELLLGKVTTAYEVYLALETETTGTTGVLSGTAKVKVGASAALGVQAALAATIKAKVTPAATVVAQAALAGTAKTRAGTSAALAARAALSGTATARISVAGKLASTSENIGKLSGSAIVKTTASANLGARAAISVTLAVKMSGSVRLIARSAVAGQVFMKIAAKGTVGASVGLSAPAKVKISAVGSLVARASIVATARVIVRSSIAISATGAKHQLVVYTTVIPAPRLSLRVSVAKPLPLAVAVAAPKIPLSVSVGKPLPLSVSHSKATPLTTQLE